MSLFRASMNMKSNSPSSFGSVLSASPSMTVTVLANCIFSMFSRAILAVRGLISSV